MFLFRTKQSIFLYLIYLFIKIPLPQQLPAYQYGGLGWHCIVNLRFTLLFDCLGLIAFISFHHPLLSFYRLRFMYGHVFSFQFSVQISKLKTQQNEWWVIENENKIYMFLRDENRVMVAKFHVSCGPTVSVLPNPWPVHWLPQRLPRFLIFSFFLFCFAFFLLSPQAGLCH